MVNESTLSKLKWICVSANISSIATFISTSLINYVYKTSMTLTENTNISLYSIPIVLGIAGSIFLISYYIFSKRNRNDDDDEKWRFFPANTS
jgi:hypothetical protein